MGLLLLRPFRMFIIALLADESPRRLALGLALGMMVGLLPKGNLTAVALTFVVFASKVSWGAAIVGALGFSWVGPMADPISHRIGMYLLTLDRLVPYWQWADTLPLARWTALNNTVVLGSLVLGVLLVYPVYCLGLVFFVRVREPIAQRLRRFKLARILMGAELASKWRVG